jgi:hypothetical protein
MGQPIGRLKLVLTSMLHPNILRADFSGIFEKDEQEILTGQEIF